MRKTDRKIDNTLRVVLTEVCEIAQVQYQGFEWLTHFVNYHDFPASLSVVCVYDTNNNLKKTDREGICMLIKEKLAAVNVDFRNIHQQVSFDTEENCQHENNGKWHERFR